MVYPAADDRIGPHGDPQRSCDELTVVDRMRRRGIGKLSVSVTPSIQISTDMQKLALSQQRARALMEWLASMGLKATMGTASADAETALAIGPGVDLMIAAGSIDPSKPEAPKAGSSAP